MIHLVTILHRTPAKIHRNSQSCRAKITSSVVNADAGGAHFLVKGLALDPSTTKTNYRQIARVYMNAKGVVPNNPKVFVWCGCAWFKYFCEVALAIRGSSYIVNSNGALPKITNPTARPQVCKHALAFLRKIHANREGLKAMATKNVATASTGRMRDAALDDLMVSRARAAKGKSERNSDVGSLGTRTL